MRERLLLITRDLKDNRVSILNSLLVSVIAGIIYIIFLVVSSCLFADIPIVSIALISLGLLAACIVSPICVFKVVAPEFVFNSSISKIKVKRLLLEELCIVAVCIIFEVAWELLIYYLAVGVAEEFLFRLVLTDYLNSKMSRIMAICWSALLFAVVFHMNYSFLSNICLRLPLGLLLALINDKMGFPEACAAHAIYDIAVSL